MPEFANAYPLHFQVRGTPRSGKTTLMKLLHAHILSQDPGAVVEVITGWEKESQTEIGDPIVQRVHTSSGKGHLALAIFRCFSCPRAS